MIDYSLEIKNAKKRLEKNLDYKLMDLYNLKIIHLIWFGIFWVSGCIGLFINPIAASVSFIMMIFYLIVILDLKKDIRDFIRERK